MDEGHRVEAFRNPAEHLLAELGRLDLMIQRQVLWMRAANLITEDDFRGMYVADAQVDALLSSQERLGTRSGAEQSGEAFANHEKLAEYIELARLENQAMAEAGRRQGADLPLVSLQERFGLSEMEMDVLLLAAAPELDLAYETLYAYVQNDITRKHPTVDLALKLFAPTLEDRLSSLDIFAPHSALLRYHLVELVEDPQDRLTGMLGHFIQTDRRMIDFMLGKLGLDQRLAGFAQLVQPARVSLDGLLLPESVRAVLQAVAELAGRDGAPTRQRDRMPAGPDLILGLHGPHGAGKRASVQAICARLEAPLITADLRRLIASGEQPLPPQFRLLAREAALHNAALYIGHCEALLSAETPIEDEYSVRRLPPSDNQVVSAALTEALRHVPGPVFLSSDLAEGELPWAPNDLSLNGRYYRVEFTLAEYPLRVQAWNRAIERAGLGSLNGDIPLLADKFRLTPGQIEAAVKHAGSLLVLRQLQASPTGASASLTIDDLHAGARAQSGQGLRRLAQKIEPFHKFEDIVLPPRQYQQLKEILTSVRYRHVVYSEWGFDRKLALGKGLNVLFSGQSGTGKTMAAEIIAGQLQLDLYKIDLASVVSKYIGETEKNLNRIFQEASNSNAILQFDEADALLGKRSEVKDAHDRYANIEVAYLLQKMEAYDGIVILTTNMRKNLDEAFVRRMHLTIEFPFPDPPLRLRIWENIFPGKGELLAAGVDLGFLAQQFDLAGGNIRNAALAAAFNAAERGSRQIEMKDLILATASELHKMGRLPSKASFRQYYDLIRDGLEAVEPVNG